jgi:hypothetical protein
LIEQEVDMFLVSYTAKNKQGYLIDKNKSFKELIKAYKYMHKLKKDGKIVGQAVLERVS